MHTSGGTKPANRSPFDNGSRNAHVSDVTEGAPFLTFQSRRKDYFRSTDVMKWKHNNEPQEIINVDFSLTAIFFFLAKICTQLDSVEGSLSSRHQHPWIYIITIMYSRSRSLSPSSPLLHTHSYTHTLPYQSIHSSLTLGLSTFFSFSLLVFLSLSFFHFFLLYFAARVGLNDTGILSGRSKFQDESWDETVLPAVWYYTLQFQGSLLPPLLWCLLVRSVYLTRCLALKHQQAGKDH